jgi:hypothetical protein
MQLRHDLFHARTVPERFRGIHAGEGGLIQGAGFRDVLAVKLRNVRKK